MSTPLPKVGDRIRVTDNFPNGDLQVREFTVTRISYSDWFESDYVGVYLSGESFPAHRTWEITSRVPIPEPTGIGAVIEDNDGDKWLRVGPDDWRYITANGTPGYATGVTWATLIEDYSSDVTVVSEGVQA